MSSYPIVRIDPSTPGRERSPALWRQLLEQYGNDPMLGVLHSDEFVRPSVNATVATAHDGWFLSEDGLAGSAAEAFSTVEGADGFRTLFAVTSGDHMGVKAQAGESATVGESVVLTSHTTDSKGAVVFEARVYLDTAANDTFFIGLAEADSSMLDNTSVLEDDLDYIGFYRLDGGDLQFVSRNDNDGGTAVEYNVDVVASADIPEDGYVKLGIRVNAGGTVEVFVDGARVRKSSGASPTDIVVPFAALPIEYLTRTLLAARGVTLDNSAVSIKCDNIECYVSE